MTKIPFIALCTALMAVTASAFAQAYPVRPVRLVVGAAPGGGTDFVARVISPDLAQTLGQGVIIDNRGGAAGVAAGSLVAKSVPDGYTLLMMTSNYPTFPSLYKDLDFHPLNDFAHISNIAVVPYVLVVHPSLAITTPKELIALAKAKPQTLNYASSGRGSMGHLAGEQFRRMAGVEMQHVTYKGAGPASIALLSGEVQLSFQTLPSALTQIGSGKLRGVAVTSEKRSPIAQQLPTLAESGLPGFEASSWFGLVAPKGTPPSIVDRLYKASSTALQNTQVRARLASEGMETIGNTPQEFSRQVAADLKRWAEVIRNAKLAPE